jgi:plastocyanin
LEISVKAMAILCACVAGCAAIETENLAALGSGSDDGSGSGSDAGSGSGSDSCPAPPALAVALAPTPLATELRTTNHVTAIISTQSFASAGVTVELDAFDHTTHAAVAGWTITPAQWLAVPATGAVVAGFDVTIPSDSATLVADMRVRATDGTTIADASGTITVAQQLTIDIPVGTGATAPHAGMPDLLRVRSGTQLRFYNADEIQHAIHGDGGILHEQTTLGQPGTIFAVTVTADGAWYCHTHELAADAHYVTVVP